MKHLAMVLMISLLSAVTAPAQSDGTASRSEMDRWRLTIQFGTHSQIQELIGTLADQRISELLPEVTALFADAENRGVLQAAIDYFIEVESDNGIDRARELLQSYREYPPELVQSVLRYWRTVEAPLSDESREYVRELAADPNGLLASPAIQLLAQTEPDGTYLIELYQRDETDDEVRGQILLALGELQDPATFDFVTDILGDEEEANTMLERFALDTLGKLGDQKGLEIVIRHLDAQDSLTRAYAVGALTNFRGPEVDRALTAALRDDFWRVRVSALEAIAERKTTSSFEAVRYKMFYDSEARVRNEAVDTIVALDLPESWEALRERLLDRRAPEGDRALVAAKLAEHHSDADVKALAELLAQEWDKENSQLVHTVGRAVSRNAHPNHRPLIETLLGHPNGIVQIYAVRAIGRAGLKDLGEEVIPLAQADADSPLKRAAASALDTLGIDVPEESGDGEGEDS